MGFENDCDCDCVRRESVDRSLMCLSDAVRVDGAEMVMWMCDQIFGLPGLAPRQIPTQEIRATTHSRDMLCLVCGRSYRLSNCYHVIEGSRWFL